ncbi:DUF504 domain-containing protein [Methanocella sp. MCL-LM]|uniref:DUF504 domain-containing protein n=1 Tax=Methanocella sp. MCL-LM TaxID=3412035 RepID=UPI003C71990B
MLNRLKWKAGESLSDATIYYVSRGSPRDSATVSGDEIKEIGAFGLELESGSVIPYHRVYRIDYRDATIFDQLWYRHALRH